jgi:hypothetical protein
MKIKKYDPSLFESIVDAAKSGQSVNIKVDNNLEIINIQREMENSLGKLINQKVMNEHQANNVQRNISYIKRSQIKE